MGEVVALAKSRRLVSTEDVEIQSIEIGTPAPRRMAIAVAVSVVLHGLVLVALLSLPQRPPLYTPVVVFPVSLVSMGGGEGGGGGSPEAAPTPPPPAVPPEPAAVAPPKTAPVAVPMVRPKDRKPASQPRPAAPPSAVASAPADGAAGAAVSPPGVGGSESGVGGDGSGPGGGSGFSAAGPAYGVNPRPPYPMVAVRLKLEGTVVLRVFVAADGTPKRVDVLKSSGHDSLDTAAATTVRSRWRFLPARRNGIPVEDSVQVPIRFFDPPG